MLTDKEFSKKLQNMFHQAPIAKSMGITMEYNQNGQAIFHMPYNSNFDHALGGVHGGVYATLLDNAGWFTAALRYSTWIVTVEFSTRLLEGVVKEDLYSIGTLVRTGKRISSCSMELFTKSDKLVAIGQGTFSVTSSKIS